MRARVELLFRASFFLFEGKPIPKQHIQEKAGVNVIAYLFGIPSIECTAELIISFPGCVSEATPDLVC